MEHLLRDGDCDLDSMDRSLIDYNQSKVGVAGHAPNILNGNGHVEISSTDNSKLLSAATINISPATPVTTPTSPCGEAGLNVMPVIKRDLVVRFTEQQNSVRCEMAKSDKSGRGSKQEATPSTVREQYEVQHYARHPHGPQSPCDSENSVCNRSRENLIGKKFVPN